MSTALKELPKLVVPSGLLGRIVTVNAAVEKATREVSSQHKMASLCVRQGVNKLFVLLRSRAVPCHHVLLPSVRNNQWRRYN